MIRETFFNKYNGGWGTGFKPEGKVIFIMRSREHVLSPSWSLWNAWQIKNRRLNKMTWTDYTIRFLEEMKSPQAINEIKRLAKLSHTWDIWLVCSCFNSRRQCHRFLVMDLIKQAGGLVAVTETKSL